MADILYQHPEATTDANASVKLPIQAMAFSRESGKFIYKKTDGGIEEIPSLSFLGGDFSEQDPANLIQTNFSGIADRVTDALNELYGMIGTPGSDNLDLPWLGEITDLTTASTEEGWGYFTANVPTGTPFSGSDTVLYQCIGHGFGGSNAAFNHQILTNTQTGKIYVRGVLNVNGNITSNGWVLVNPDSVFTVSDTATIDMVLTGLDISANVKDLSITTAKLADDSVTSAKIVNGTITGSDIATETITSSNILDGTIVNADINTSAGIATSKLASQAATSVLGRSANSTGTPAAIAATADGQVLKRSSSSLVFAQIVDADIANGTISVGKIATSSLNTANGLAKLDASGFVPSSILPSYVDDVIEASSFATLPVTGETGKIYVTLDTNESWRWGGSAYIKIADDTASGVAGGDLTGSYPNPSIAASAVTTSKLANEAVSLAKLGPNSVDRSKLHGTIYKEIFLTTSSSLANSGIIEVCSLETFQYVFSLRVVLGRSGGYGNERVFDIAFTNKSSNAGDVTSGDLTYTTPDIEEEWELVMLSGSVGSRIALKRTYGSDTHVFDANVNGFIFGFAESSDGGATQTLLFGSAYGTESLPVGATTTKINGNQLRVMNKIRLENFSSKDGWGAKVGGSKGLIIPSYESGKALAGEGITYWGGIASVTYPFSSVVVGSVEASWYDGANTAYVSKSSQTVSFTASDFDATTPFCQVYIDVVSNAFGKKKGALTDVERLTKFPLFIAYSNNLSTVSGLSYNTMFAQSAKSVLREMFNAIGNPKQGLAVNWTGTTRGLKVDAGAVFAMGASPSTLEKPNTYPLSANVSASWFEATKNGLVTPANSVSSVNVTQWDNNGTLTNIQNNKFVNHRLFMQIDEAEASKCVYFLQLGQAEYANLSDAEKAAKTEKFTRNEATSRMVLLAVISVKQGSSDLSSANCTITSSDIWGGIGGLGGSSSSTSFPDNFFVVKNAAELKAAFGATPVGSVGIVILCTQSILVNTNDTIPTLAQNFIVMGSPIQYAVTSYAFTGSVTSIKYYNDVQLDNASAQTNMFGSTGSTHYFRNLYKTGAGACTFTAGSSMRYEKLGQGSISGAYQAQLTWDNTFVPTPITQLVRNIANTAIGACANVTGIAQGKTVFCRFKSAAGGVVDKVRTLAGTSLNVAGAELAIYKSDGSGGVTRLGYVILSGSANGENTYTLSQSASFSSDDELWLAFYLPTSTGSDGWFSFLPATSLSSGAFRIYRQTSSGLKPSANATFSSGDISNPVTERIPYMEFYS